MSGNLEKDIPDFIVHYNRGEPFRSITSLSREGQSEVIERFDETNTWGLARFSDQHYMSQRLQTEQQLRETFLELGGRPVLENPIYFFLGRNAHFEEHKGNLGYLIYLRDIDPGTISFTYGDSLFSFNNHYGRQVGVKYQNPLCAKLHLLANLKELFMSSHFPKIDPLHIEAQLWARPEKRSVRSLDHL